MIIIVCVTRETDLCKLNKRGREKEEEKKWKRYVGNDEEEREEGEVYQLRSQCMLRSYHGTDYMN